MRRYTDPLGQSTYSDASGQRMNRDQFGQHPDRIGCVPRVYGEDLGQRAGRRGLQAVKSWALQRAETLAALVAVALFGLAAAFSPSYRPSARGAIAPYLGHSFTLLRTFIDVRPQVVFTALSDGVRFAGIL